MEQGDIVRHVLGVLDQLAIPYAIVGSFASIAYGEPRYTLDIDILIELPATKIAVLCQSFSGPDWYISRQGVEEAVRTRRPFNAIHTTSGNKIDFIVSGDDPWSRLELERRQFVGLLQNLDGFAAHPEDVILGKLLYYREGGSDKHLRDINGMLSISGHLIDRQHLATWAERLGVLELWQRVIELRGE